MDKKPQEQILTIEQQRFWKPMIDAVHAHHAAIWGGNGSDFEKEAVSFSFDNPLDKYNGFMDVHPGGLEEIARNPWSFVYFHKGHLAFGAWVTGGCNGCDLE